MWKNLTHMKKMVTPGTGVGGGGTQTRREDLITEEALEMVVSAAMLCLDEKWYADRTVSVTGIGEGVGTKWVESVPL